MGDLARPNCRGNFRTYQLRVILPRLTSRIQEAMKSALPWPRGYFAIGVEGISKPVNLGNLLRSAHSFGASFVFTIGADPRVMDTIADTSCAPSHLPLYHWQSIEEMRLPRG